MTISTSDEYDNIVTFGRVLAETLFFGTEEPVKSLLAYFEKPHKWEGEYQKWRELGGTLDRECLESLIPYVPTLDQCGESAGRVQAVYPGP